MKSPPRKLEAAIRANAKIGLPPRKIAKRLGVRVEVVRETLERAA